MRTRIIPCLTFIALAASALQAFAQSGDQQGDPLQAAPLEDVVVLGKPVVQQAEEFVASISAPPVGRKLATWRGRICVGAAGMAAEPANFMVNRVLDWGHSLGVRTGAAGCDPNILIVATDDGDRTARELVEARPRDFDSGTYQSDQGARALHAFQSSGDLVRWWAVSLPIDQNTGNPIVRMPGEPPYSTPINGTRRPSDLGAYGQIQMASRLYDDSVDVLQSVVIIIDEDALSRVNFQQLSDYVAMVALAQIDPQTQPNLPSILNLFSRTMAQEEGLSRWDRAYLEALYSTYRTVDPARDADLVARALAKKLQSATGENSSAD